jgi:hypothetical protein
MIKNATLTTESRMPVADNQNSIAAARVAADREARSLSLRFYIIEGSRNPARAQLPEIETTPRKSQNTIGEKHGCKD